MRVGYWAWWVMPVIPALGSNSDKTVVSLRPMGPPRPKTNKQLGKKPKKLLLIKQSTHYEQV